MRIALTLAIVLAATLLAGWTSPDAVETVLHRFDGDGDGASPCSALILDEHGALYGATAAGGPDNAGTIFRLAPPGAGQRSWTKTVLYAFKGVAANDGANPMGRLIFDRQGVLYGTTKAGGSKDRGVVFKLTPPASGQTAWTETVLYRFGASGGGDGYGPEAGLIFDKEGALYGTTLGGGTVEKNTFGTVFKLTPPKGNQTAWAETLIYRFKGGGDGANPYAALIADKDGALYGTTLAGGTVGRNGYGTVFKLTPPAPGEQAWTETVLHRFAGAPRDGDSPQGQLLAGGHGALYGATFLGGSSGNQGAGYGTIFKLTPPAAGQTAWTETVLYRFCAHRDCGDGSIPEAGLIADAAGALYGATVSGGSACAAYPRSGCGTVFKLTPPVAGEEAWTETVLHRFAGGPDGANPFASLIADKSGVLYGATPYGGNSGGAGQGYGALFKLTLCPGPGLSESRGNGQGQNGCPALIASRDQAPLDTASGAEKSHFVLVSAEVDSLPAESAPDLTGPHRLSAEIDSSTAAAEGVIIAKGGRDGGFSLFVKEGKLIYEINTADGVHEELVSSRPLPSGRVRVAFAFDAVAQPIMVSTPASGLSAGVARLYIDGEEVAQAHFADYGRPGGASTEPLEIGRDTGTPVSDLYDSPFAFTGRVEKIEIDLKR
jgi:uncharacterized repeat protein (TIGR03803 family)